LSKEFSTLLTGRHIFFEIFPLSFREFLRFKGLNIEGKSDPRTKRRKIKYFLNEYIDIIYRDVLERFNIKDIETLKKL